MTARAESYRHRSWLQQNALGASEREATLVTYFGSLPTVVTRHLLSHRRDWDGQDCERGCMYLWSESALRCHTFGSLEYICACTGTHEHMHIHR